MRKLFVTADVHGYFDELKKALDDAGFDPSNPEHFFVSCGDLLDRGKQPLECLQFVNNLERKILIRGNHEDLMETMLNNREIRMHDVHNGTVDTMCNLTKISPYNIEIEDAYTKMETHPEWHKYIESVIDYYETPKYIFVHGWIPCHRLVRMSGDALEYDPEWRKAYSEDWNRSRWYCGWELWQDGIVEPNKDIVCGHWHCSAPNYYIHHEGKNQYDVTHPFEDIGIICLDACTALSHEVNVVVLEDE